MGVQRKIVVYLDGQEERTKKKEGKRKEDEKETNQRRGGKKARQLSVGSSGVDGKKRINQKPTDDNLKVLRDYQALSRTKKKEREGEEEKEKRKERRGNREERKRCRRVHTEQKHRLDAINPILGGFFFLPVGPRPWGTQSKSSAFLETARLVESKMHVCTRARVGGNSRRKRKVLMKKSTHSTTGSRKRRKKRCGENKHSRRNSRGSTIGYGFIMCYGADEKVKERETQGSENGENVIERLRSFAYGSGLLSDGTLIF